MIRIGDKWLRMAEMYKRFAVDYPNADFGEQAKIDMYLYESRGVPMPTNSKLNGYSLGKKWMDVTVSMWKEDIADRGLLVSELLDDYPEWFLDKIGITNHGPEWSQCGWWMGPRSR